MLYLCLRNVKKLDSWAASMWYFFRSFLILISLFLGAVYANPVKLEHTSVELISDVKRIQPGKPFWVALKLSMKPGWHTYWINPGDSGFAANIEWTLPEGFIASPIHWLPPSLLKNKNHINFGYNHEAFYLVQITPDKEISAQPQKLIAEANWLICGEVCVPESTELSLTLPVGSEEGQPDYSDHQALIHQLKDELPQQLPIVGEFEAAEDIIYFTLSLAGQDLKEIDSVQLFPFKNGMINNNEDQKFTFENNLLTIIAPNGKATDLDNYEALVQINDKTTNKIHNYQVVFTPNFGVGHHIPGEGLTLLSILAFGFLGGLILNAMPCVFPILSIKALAFAKKKKSELSHIRLQGLIYTLGVVISFLSLAFLLIALKQGGHSIGWGFQMQSPYFITFMIYMTFLIGLSLSGVFYLPIFFGNTAAGIEENKVKGSFWLGVLAVLVATPCTAPFMGVAIGYALTQSTLIVILVFGTLALGFAVPYLLICLFPVLLKVLPKPGAWMETFKELLAFPMYATVLWLLWVLVQQGGSRALITVGAGLVIMAFCLWLWRKLSPQNRFAKSAIIIAFAGLSLAPITYLESPALKESIMTEPFSKALLEKYRREKIPVFVNATASWCITCKYNELTLQGQFAESLFKRNGIHYLEADWTNQNAEITDLLESFGRSGVPLYIYYPAGKEPVVLPQLLNEEVLKKTIETADSYINNLR